MTERALEIEPLDRCGPEYPGVDLIADGGGEVDRPAGASLHECAGNGDRLDLDYRVEPYAGSRGGWFQLKPDPGLGNSGQDQWYVGKIIDVDGEIAKAGVGMTGNCAQRPR